MRTIVYVDGLNLYYRALRTASIRDFLQGHPAFSLAEPPLRVYTKDMRSRLARRLKILARRISRRPWNRPGTDKTFVHIALHQYFLTRKALGRV